MRKEEGGAGEKGEKKIKGGEENAKERGEGGEG